MKSGISVAYSREDVNGNTLRWVRRRVIVPVALAGADYRCAQQGCQNGTAGPIRGEGDGDGEREFGINRDIWAMPLDAGRQPACP